MYFIIGSLLLLSLRNIFSEAAYSKMGPRAKFEKDFQDICSLYPFVRRYNELLTRPRNADTDEYMIYVFNEKNKGGNGGLGDRLGGLITAMAFALRTNRIFLIHGDKSFEESFRPYASAAGDRKYFWSNWEEWAGWHPSFHKNMTFNRGCVNPRPGNVACALDSSGKINYKAYKVVKHRGNRAYLCRWGIRDSLGMQKELMDVLGITRQTDLYEAAGCMLRLAMWPTDALWDTLDHWLAGSVGSGSPVSTQVGVHFRCGDASFSAVSGSTTNSQCVFQGADTWKGTSFADDFSLDSPVDEANCAKQILTEYASKTGGIGVLAYIASDNADSARQVNATMRWPVSLTPTDSCHVDLAVSPLCSRMTFVQWFMLSLSDKIVMQSLKNNPNANSPYHAVSEETYTLNEEFKKYASQGPISAFSRYAAIYGLQKDGLRYGLGCQVINKTALSWQTQGNWLCGPKLFY